MRWLLVIILSVAFLSCNNHVVFQEREEMPDMMWTYSNPLGFNVEINDTAALYDIYLDVEHSRDFTYGNLYIGLKVISAGKDTSFQRISIALADKLGQWLGTCKGNECSRQFLISDKYQFTETGNNQIIVEQNSREEELQGIKSIELTILDAEE